MKILVTGTAGFIGFHFANRMANEGFDVVGLDCINSYYDVQLKYARLTEAGIDKAEIQYGKLVQSHKNEKYRFIQLQLEDAVNIEELFVKEKFDYVCHLAAQAGVRYSLENPNAYIESNVKGFLNILEACRIHPVRHLMYASSSSVYGLNRKQPFSVTDQVDTPVSLYAATKKSNELMAHTYSHLFDIPTTGLRFFTVYGPWGRPDMAYFSFSEAIRNGEPIKVFNNGKNSRDFTYIDDIVESMARLILLPPNVESQAIEGMAPKYSIYNIGNSAPVELLTFIEHLEEVIGKSAIKVMVPSQPGDVDTTFADVDALYEKIQFRPTTPLSDGLRLFYDWYKNYEVKK